MAADVNLALQSLTTVTATGTSTALNIPTGTASRGIPVRLVATTVSGTSPTFSAKIQESTDGTTYIDLLNLTNPATNVNSLTAAGQLSGNLQTEKAYVRLVYTIGGTAPSYVFKCEPMGAQI